MKIISTGVPLLSVGWCLFFSAKSRQVCCIVRMKSFVFLPFPFYLFHFAGFSWNESSTFRCLRRLSCNIITATITSCLFFWFIFKPFNTNLKRQTPYIYSITSVELLISSSKKKKQMPFSINDFCNGKDAFISFERNSSHSFTQLLGE